MKHGAVALLIGLLAFAPAGASALSLIDFTGYSYETGTFPPSNPGDLLNLVAIADGLTQPLVWDPNSYEYTMHLSGLISQGAQQGGPDNIVVVYTGGNFDLYEDSSYNAALGINPPNATVPGTFMDGTHFLGGQLNAFTIFYNTRFNSGAFEADVTFVNGAHFGDLGPQTTGYTFGGVFRFDTPQGYDLQWDGQILLDPVAVETVTWGQVKSAFRR